MFDSIDKELSLSALGELGVEQLFCDIELPCSLFASLVDIDVELEQPTGKGRC